MKDSIFAIRRTLQNYTNGGYVLIMVTVLAMIIANSPLASMYFSWWDVPVSLQIGSFNLFEPPRRTDDSDAIYKRCSYGNFLFLRRTRDKKRSVGR